MTAAISKITKFIVSLFLDRGSRVSRLPQKKWSAAKYLRLYGPVKFGKKSIILVKLVMSKCDILVELSFQTKKGYLSLQSWSKILVGLYYWEILWTVSSNFVSLNGLVADWFKSCLIEVTNVNEWHIAWKVRTFPLFVEKLRYNRTRLGQV